MNRRGGLVWEHGWKGHEDAQLRRLAELSLAEKLVWLERAQQLVRQVSRPGTIAPGVSDR